MRRLIPFVMVFCRTGFAGADPAIVRSMEKADRVASSTSPAGKAATIRAAEEPGNPIPDLVEKEPSFRKILQMPFAYCLFWAYPFDAGRDFEEAHELCCFLLV